MKQHSWKRERDRVVFFCIMQIAGLLFVTVSHANKLVLSAGAYSFTAENQSNKVSASISGVGSYQLAYRHVLSQNVELDFGFSLVATETFGGDLAFGLDVGANYYPISNAEPIQAETGSANVSLSDRWRPFVGAGFHQRNFQSTSSQYAGFGIKAGSEFQMTEEVCFQGAIRYLMLGGPNQASATQIDLLGGLVFQF